MESLIKIGQICSKLHIVLVKINIEDATIDKNYRRVKPMNIQQKLTTLLGTAATALCLVSIAGQAAQAGTLYKGWNYAIDSFNDGYEGGIVGHNSDYEFYGMAVQEDADSLYVAFNSNLQLDGWAYGGASDGHIGWGDLFLNFSGDNFLTAQANGDLFGIRFAENSDSNVGLGVYSGVTAQNVTRYNSGFNNLNQHSSYVQNKGGTATLGDLAQSDPYLTQTGNWTILNSMNSGTKIGDVNIIEDVSGLGLEFGNFGATGNHTFAISVDKSLLPEGDFIASIFAECGNDGMALAGTIASVPEPTATIGLAVFGLTFFASKRRLRRQ